MHRTSMFKNFLLVLFSLLLVLLAAEAGLRVTGIGSYSTAERVLFYSKPSLLVDEHGVVRYTPDSMHRVVAVYGENIEFDTTQAINNWGFVDNVDYLASDENVKDVVFIGDSFTESTGGNSTWVQLLRKNARQRNVAFHNFGIGGTGILHFSRLLKHVQPLSGIDELYIVALSDDFYRPYWYPIADDRGVRFCTKNLSEADCIAQEKPIIQHLEGQESDSQIIERARSVYAEAAVQAEKPFYASLNLFNIACDAYLSVSHGHMLNENCPWLNRTARHLGDPALQERFRQSLVELESIARDFDGSVVKVLHLPTKPEIVSGEYNLDLAQVLAGHSVGYVSLLEQCEWSLDMFYTHDDHPNDMGYQNIANCLARVLEF